MFQKQRLSSIVACPGDNTKRLILLKESVTEKSLVQLPEDLRKWILDQDEVEVVDYSLTLDYNYFTANEVGFRCTLECLGFISNSSKGIRNSICLRTSGSLDSSKPP